MPRVVDLVRPYRAALSGAAFILAVLAVPPATPAPGPPGHPARGGAPGRGPLPDTVLARVGANRIITVTTFRQAWEQVQDPQHPDSLTPQAARRFLDLMISKEALGARALASGAPWSRRDSLQFMAFRDQLVMKTVLDSALAETARRRQRSGAPALQPMDLGVAARESAMTRLEVRYDAALAARLALAWKALPVPPSDSSMQAQLRMKERMPVVAPSDTGRAIAHSSLGDYKVSEALAQWGWLDPWTRPRIETAEAVEELARNGLFERLLRSQAAARRLERRPELAAMIQSRREYAAVSAMVAREVYDRIHPDSAAMRAWYRGHPESYRLPDRAHVARWVMPDRAGAGRFAAVLRNPATAESLIAQGHRSGADFRDEITARTDSLLFGEAWRLGAGTVIGPDTVAGGWRVARVMDLEPARVRRYDEARDLIAREMTDSLGEAGMRALVARIRRETKVEIHPRAVALMTSAR